jgi:crossover junction endodeoxyribonuclease RusA
VFEFRVYGRPAPQGSKKFVGNGRFIEASKYLKPWREAISKAIFARISELGEVVKFTDPVIVSATFIIPKPESVKGRLWPSKMPDLDKLQRALGDALETDTGLLESDSLIVRWEASKVYTTPSEALGGVLVSIRLASEDDLAKITQLFQK